MGFLHSGDVGKGPQEMSRCEQRLEVGHLLESPQRPQWVSVCYLLRLLKGVLAESTLPDGAPRQDPAQASRELRATANPTKAADPSEALTQRKQPALRVCVLFIQAEKGYSFQPAREMLGYVTLGMKKMRLAFFLSFFSFSWRKKCCEIV